MAHIKTAWASDGVDMLEYTKANIQKATTIEQLQTAWLAISAGSKNDFTPEQLTILTTAKDLKKVELTPKN